jgi:hypothetical protein
VIVEEGIVIIVLCILIFYIKPKYPRPARRLLVLFLEIWVRREK